MTTVTINAGDMERIAKKLQAVLDDKEEAGRAKLQAETESSYLGREFLTWLVFHAATAEGKFQTEDASEFTIGFGEKCLLASVAREDIHEVVAKGGAPTDSTDVLFAISNGMSVREAELVIRIGERTHAATVEFQSFSIKKSKLKGLLSAKMDESRDVIAERLMLLDELEDCLRQAFEHFLPLRFSAAWSATVIPAMRAWLIDGLVV